jgi:hypothetical protein
MALLDQKRLALVDTFVLAYKLSAFLLGKVLRLLAQELGAHVASSLFIWRALGSLSKLEDLVSRQ